MTRITRIQVLLEAQLTIRMLDIRDDSARHAGHAGNAGGAETHLILSIDAAELDGLSRVAQHRVIQQILEAEFKSGLHALTIKIGEGHVIR